MSKIPEGQHDLPVYQKRLAQMLCGLTSQQSCSKTKVSPDITLNQALNHTVTHLQDTNSRSSMKATKRENSDKLQDMTQEKYGHIHQKNIPVYPEEENTKIHSRKAETNVQPEHETKDISILKQNKRMKTNIKTQDETYADISMGSQQAQCWMDFVSSKSITRNIEPGTETL